MTDTEKSERTSVLVIGGGLAGLAAAGALANHGCRVTLIESRQRLGGRASSFRDPASEAMIDNCQHVSMGCCTNLAAFCRQAGIAGLLAKQRWLYFQDERGRVSRVGSWPLPAPLHLTPSFAFASFLSLTDKLRIAYGFWKLLRQPHAKAGQPFHDWLMQNGQNQRTCERFWSVILVSALNEKLENIEYRYARQVFVEGFLWNHQSAVVEIPTVPLGELYGEPVARWLEKSGVELCLNTAAKSLQWTDNRITGCQTRCGKNLAADHYILAVPFQRVLSLLPENLAAQSPFSLIGRLQPSPITSVHLWFDRSVMPLPHLVPVGRTVQWLFPRQQGSGETGQYVQAVISASAELAEAKSEDIFRRILAEVREILPHAVHAEVLHHRVVTERAATYGVHPGVDEWRPAQQTPVGNLWLAGDYTQTGWPATMEGAVRSGYLAAEALLAQLGRPVRLTQPPLPICPITKLLLRQ